ncbi:DoxX family protein [Metabacillus fastidiosus]|uniref:DoxX family protein n=1 Tax=Metabacillus fastidiosus TaxID=1458 RepID=UPI002E1DCDB2|nr:DoxX family protein [Metabacillus fastidiosus]
MNSSHSLKLIRYLVAYVFIISGLMKLLDNELSNYFINLGLPFPIYTMYIIVILEISCGIFILLNKKMRHAVIPLIIIMIGAILITKVPSLHLGLLQFAFNARLDIVMLVLLFILYSRSRI